MFDRTLRFPEVIILDDDADNVNHRQPMPVQIEVDESPEQKQPWDDMSDTLTNSIKRNSVGGSVISQKGNLAGENASHALVREKQGHFFDHLCV